MTPRLGAEIKNTYWYRCHDNSTSSDASDLALHNHRKTVTSRWATRSTFHSLWRPLVNRLTPNLQFELHKRSRKQMTHLSYPACETRKQHRTHFTYLHHRNNQWIELTHLWPSETSKSRALLASRVKMTSLWWDVSDWDAMSNACSTGFDLLWVTWSTQHNRTRLNAFMRSCLFNASAVQITALLHTIAG